jgi:hypothetical protein
MKFEIECCYYDTGLAGEDVRLLDRAQLSHDLLKVTQEDFWLFDSSTVMVNDYDHTGALYQARIAADSRAVAYYCGVDRAIWDVSIPFRQFYKANTGIDL